MFHWTCYYKSQTIHVLRSCIFFRFCNIYFFKKIIKFFDIVFVCKILTELLCHYFTYTIYFNQLFNTCISYFFNVIVKRLANKLGIGWTNIWNTQAINQRWKFNSSGFFHWIHKIIIWFLSKSRCCNYFFIISVQMENICKFLNVARVNKLLQSFLW